VKRRTWGNVRAWVRRLPSGYVVTWQYLGGHGRWLQGGTRKLTWRERLLWHLAARVPRP
jgi:hypothetical protein